MSRTHRILGGLLLFQVVLILLIRNPFGGGSGAATPEPLFPVLASLEPTRIEILGSEPDVAVNLDRGDGGWGIREAGGFPADAERVDTLLDSLRELEVARPVVQSSRYHGAMKVADDDRVGRVRIYGESPDEPVADLYIGSSPNFRVVHVRQAGEDAVYEARGINAYDARAETSAWVDRKLVDVDVDRIRSFVLANDAGTVEIERTDDGWKVLAPEASVGSDLDEAAIDGFLRSAASMSLADPVGPVDASAHGFDPPAATLTILLEDGEPAVGGEPAEPVEPSDEPAEGRELVETVEPLVISIGAVDPDNDSRRFATRSGFEYAVTVWSGTADPLLERSIDDWLEGDDES